MRALSAMALAALVAVLFFVSGCNEPQIVACEKDSDCALGLNLDKCCSCVEAFHLSEFSSNQGLTKYEAEKDYNYYRPLIKANCGNQECKMCPEPSQTKAVCENQKCTTKYTNPAETTGKFCTGYEGGLMSQEEMESCTCPEGQTKMRCLASAYCATQSMKECKSSEDCPEGERCISSDGTNWHCTGQQCGCYHYDPKNPEMQICAD